MKKIENFCREIIKFCQANRGHVTEESEHNKISELQYFAEDLLEPVISEQDPQNFEFTFGQITRSLKEFSQLVENQILLWPLSDQQRHQIQSELQALQALHQAAAEELQRLQAIPLEVRQAKEKLLWERDFILRKQLHTHQSAASAYLHRVCQACERIAIVYPSQELQTLIERASLIRTQLAHGEIPGLDQKTLFTICDGAIQIAQDMGL